MSFKIYTYVDPYKISQTDFWEEIKTYPHLCASRTLVRGLRDVIGDDQIEALYCPADDIIDRIFAEWKNDVSLRLEQYSELGQIYSSWRKNKNFQENLGENYYEALLHNKNSMLDAIRLFIELGINADSLSTTRINTEHRLFVYLLKLLQKNDKFRLPEMPSIKELKEKFILQAKKEKDDKITLSQEEPISEETVPSNELKVLDRMISNTKQWDGEHVIFHGIHQFTPLQLRLIDHLNKQGVEVIFLYNYIPEYKGIYSSWDYVYQQFNAPIHHDTKIKSYEPDYYLQRKGNAIASNLALLCEEGISSGDSRFRNNFELYKNETIQEFDNISEYAGYISDRFIDAEQEVLSKNPEWKAIPKNRLSTSPILARMDDTIYSANKDVDELLQVYHPEYARTRHFLAYPIGQFFVALYDLWNESTKEINIDFDMLRDSINSGIMSDYDSNKLLKTLINIEPLFAHISTYSEFKRLFSDYGSSYSMVLNAAPGSLAFELKTLNIYNEITVQREDLNNLFKAITELNNTAIALFGDATEDEQIEFSTHFTRLKELVGRKQTALISEEEHDLIEQLLDRLDVIQKQTQITERKGTFDDLKNGLYFFLKQKEEPVSDWFVKNFEQIEGDVLLSKKQNIPGRHKVYHFACVSDEDMNKSVDELLPWPLSEMFIERAYNPKDLPFQVYYTALGERANFMRYALFYGLYFCQCDTKISFVKGYGDKVTDYYGLLKLIGLESDKGKWKDYKAANKNKPSKTGEKKELALLDASYKVNSLKYEHDQMFAMFLCPNRFLLDYVIDESPILSGSFLLSHYYQNILIEYVWRDISEKNKSIIEKSLSNIIDRNAAKLEAYFPFLNDSEKIDIRRQAENYILNQIVKTSGKQIKRYDKDLMHLRKLFGKAKFMEDMQDAPPKHIYEPFEKLAKIEKGQKIYSAYNVPWKLDESLKECMLNYLNDPIRNVEDVGSWCSYCADKNICLAPYKKVQNGK